MSILRTPDECFASLPGYPFKPHYVEVDAGVGFPSGAVIRMHYVDEGPATASETILCLHGEPSWCVGLVRMSRNALLRVHAMLRAGHTCIGT